MKELLTQSCYISTVNERFAVLLFKNENYYHLISRQIKSAKLSLAQQKDILVCGWTGMTVSVTKKQIIKNIRINHKINKRQTISTNNEERLINDISISIQDYERLYCDCKKDSSIQNTILNYHKVFQCKWNMKISVSSNVIIMNNNTYNFLQL